MSKKAILIHGWQGSAIEGWRPWLRDALVADGFEVVIPTMPNTNFPEMADWLAHFETFVTPDKDTYFVGHSLGCIAVLRYLETLEADVQIGGAVLVAGFTSNLGIDEIDSFFETKINWEKVNSHGASFAAIHSTNDPYVSTHYAEFFKDNLNAEIIMEDNKKHYSAADNITELPSALSALMNMSK